jgi:hypothetical protein
MRGLGEGRKTSGVAEEIAAVNISLLQMSHWCFLFFENKEEPLVLKCYCTHKKF